VPELYLLLVVIGGASLISLGALLYLTIVKQNTKKSLSPYIQKPLRSANDLHYTIKNKVLRYLYQLKQFDNQMFDFEKAAYCRDTGRLFKECVNWLGQIEVDWTFIQKAHSGNYVSWGSLTREQQLLVSQKHGSLDGFQVEESSPSSSPRSILRIYALLKPGPLYVDYETGILVGWKEVPDTDVEVLIVQKPLKLHMPKWMINTDNEKTDKKK
jgi:hypothetical protein